MSELSKETCDFLAYKFHVELLGRKPSKDDLTLRSGQIKEKGPAFVYATLFESTEAQAFRVKRGW